MQELLPFPEPEQWLPVPGWEGLYEVSDLGRVRSLRRKGGRNRWYGGKVLVPYLNKGYPTVPLPPRPADQARCSRSRAARVQRPASCRHASLPQQRAAG